MAEIKAQWEISKQNQIYLGFVLILLASLIFSSSFPVIRSIVWEVSPQLQIALRFGIAAMLLTPFFRGFTLPLLRDGAIVGILFFCLCAAEALGLQELTANRAGFIVALSVIFVTLFELIAGKPISLRVILAAFMSFVGTGIMAWNQDVSLVGASWFLICALLDSAYILVIEKVTLQHSPMQLSIISFWVTAFLGILWSFPQLSTQMEVVNRHIGAIAYLALVATILYFFVELLGQRWIPGQEVAIFRAIDPILTAILSFLLLGETLTTRDVWGGILILIAIVLVVTKKDIGEEKSSPNSPISAN
ncbi:MAG: DMT family transporter [Cyanobacteria bacterium SBLK]|nr:DMT family transporter [Cyanobacteria bacterium SBLK]